MANLRSLDVAPAQRLDRHLTTSNSAAPSLLHACIRGAIAVIARTQLSTMVHNLADGVWHLPGHELLTDARQHDRSMADRIQRDLQLLE